VCPPNVERVEKPVVVHDKILPSQRTEVQPVIHRDREQVEVHEILQPMRERDIAPTQLQHVELPAQRFESRANDAQFQQRYKEVSGRIRGDVTTVPMTCEQFERAPIVEETIRKKIIEEVQPVLYRETLRPVVVEATKPIYEHIVEAPLLCEEVRPMVDLGTKCIEGGAQACYPTQVCAPTSQVCYPTTGGYGQQEPVKMVIKEKTTILEPEGSMGRQASYPPKRMV
jgi:hypothetical protein